MEERAAGIDIDITPCSVIFFTDCKCGLFLNRFLRVGFLYAFMVVSREVGLRGKREGRVKPSYL